MTGSGLVGGTSSSRLHKSGRPAAVGWPYESGVRNKGLPGDARRYNFSPAAHLASMPGYRLKRCITNWGHPLVNDRTLGQCAGRLPKDGQTGFKTQAHIHLQRGFASQIRAGTSFGIRHLLFL